VTSARNLYIGGIILVLVSAGVVAAKAIGRHDSAADAVRRRRTEVAAGPRVQTALVTRSPGSRTLTLQAEAQPFLSVTLYSKVSGYLKEIRVDKGDRVTQGEVLAIVESPETDQQYTGAAAQAANDRVIADRDRQLVGTKLIAPEEAETAESDAQSAQARAQQFATLKGYETLRAPFSGRVTSRFADPGALVQDAQNAANGALPVVVVSQTDSLRVYVYLDQRDAADVRRGAVAVVSDPNRPQVHVTGTVARYTGEPDPSTRTLMAEIDVQNANNAIVPGSFVQVQLHVVAPSYLEMPADALVLRGNKDFAAVVTSNNTVAFREIHIVDTDGVTVRILDGLAEGDRVARNLGDTVIEGQHVQPVGGDTAQARAA
jgi:RND family efflux transporter MFP subunit